MKRRLALIAAAAVLAALLIVVPLRRRCGSPVLSFCGAAREVGGSCHLVETEDVRFIVDCGERGSAGTEGLPPEPSTLDFVLLTHAHTDHCGLLPELYAAGYRGKVYCTPATAELAPIMLRMKLGAAPRGDPGGDFEGVLGGITAVPFGDTMRAHSVAFRFTRAGHLLGAASVEVWLPQGEQDVKLVFSGDLGSINLLLVPPLERPADADFVVMESTYGGAVRDGDQTAVEGRRRGFAEDVSRALRRGGGVLVPAFALGRTQEILALLDRSIREGIVPPQTEVYVDSPTAKQITTVYRRFRDELSPWAQEFYAAEPLRFPGLREVSGRTALGVHERKHQPSVFVSTSGDIEYANSPRHFMRMFDDERNLLCIVGWQDPSSLGARLLAAEGPVAVRRREGKEFREEWVTPRIEVKRYGCFSAHADQSGLLAWLGGMSCVKRVFLVHGEPDQMETLARRIRAELGVAVSVPRRGERVKLRRGGRPAGEAAVAANVVPPCGAPQEAAQCR